MGVHSASACILLLGSLGVACGSAFTEAQDGSTPDVKGDAPKPDVAGNETGSPQDGGAGTFPCGTGQACETDKDYCVEVASEDSTACVSTPLACQTSRDEKTCDCDLLHVSSTLECTCTGSAGKWVLSCARKMDQGDATGPPPADGSMPKDAGKPKDGGLFKDITVADVIHL
jgi:hypothetical protein